MNTDTVDLDEIWSARGSRCLLAILVLLLSWAARADITVTGTVTVDDVAAPSGTPLHSSPAHQTFGPEIQIALDVGRLEVDLGSVLTAGTLVEIDAGTVIVTGAGSQITLIGDLNRLHMQGTGSEIQILSGGRIDATGGACGREFGCNVFLGNSVGTDATVLVDGHGSLLSTIDTLFVADGNTDFGTLGADIIASVDLSSGGTIASERVVISGGLSGSNIQVGQLTDATVTVSGAHSRWTATRFTVAAGLNAFATVNVTTGGALIGTDSFMAAIDATAVADISVDGVGSIIDVGTDMLIGLSGTATLTASNKGTVTVGRLLAIGLEPTGTGTASFDGIGTRLTAGDVLVGNTGDGSLNVTGGAVVVIDGVGGDARLGIAPKLGSTGDVSIEGAGSTITVIGTRHSSVVVGTVEFDTASSADGAGMGSLTISDSGLLEVLATQAHGESDILVGYGGDGILQIDTGGSLILDGWLGVGGHSGTGTVNVLSGGTLLVHDGEGGDDRGIGIEIGLRRGQDANGVGTMTVSGLGSSVTVLGEEAFIGIGFAHSEDPESGNAFGQLNVTNGASMTIQANDDMGGIIAGVGGGSTAVMNVTGSGSSVSISGTPAAVLIFASDIDKGVGGAQASLLLDDGASIDVFGTLPEADGRSVVAFGMGLGDATGIVSGGSTLDVDGDLFVSASNEDVLSLFPELLLDGGEELTGNDSQTGSLSILDTSVVTALRTTIGNNGLLDGDGMLVSDTVTIGTGGTLNMTGKIVGNVVNKGGIVGGGLTVTGDYTQQDGILQLALAGAGAGEFDVLDVSGDIDLLGGSLDLDFVDGFTAQEAEGLALFRAGGDLTIDETVGFNISSGQPAFTIVLAEIFENQGEGEVQLGTFALLERDLADIIPPADLTDNKGSLVAALDDICVAPTGDRSADQADLQQVCSDIRNAGNTPEQVLAALSAIDTEESTQTTDAVLLFTIPQHGNLSQRINGIRAGASPFDFSGLNLVYDNHQIAGADLERLAKGLIGLAAGDADEFAKWGMFGNGNINFGDNDATDNGGGFDYDTISITLGADYRARDNLVFGGTVSYSNVEADFNEGGGMDLDSWAGSLFGTFFLKDRYYFDLLGTYGKNDIEVVRHIVYETAMGSIDRRALSDTEGEQYSFSFGTGYDFTPGAWVVGPHAGANYSELKTDSYTETGAQGLNLSVNSQTATSFTTNLGFQVSRTFTPPWGVLIPYVRADWVHEFEDDAGIVEVGFANDPLLNDPTDSTQPILVSTDERDQNYFVMSAGFSVQLIRGISGFLNYRTTQGLKDLSLTDITGGIRFERNW